MAGDWWDQSMRRWEVPFGVPAGHYDDFAEALQAALDGASSEVPYTVTYDAEGDVCRVKKEGSSREWAFRIKPRPAAVERVYQISMNEPSVLMGTRAEVGRKIVDAIREAEQRWGERVQTTIADALGASVAESLIAIPPTLPAPAYLRDHVVELEGRSPLFLYRWEDDGAFAYGEDKRKALALSKDEAEFYVGKLGTGWRVRRVET